MPRGCPEVPAMIGNGVSEPNITWLRSIYGARNAGFLSSVV